MEKIQSALYRKAVMREINSLRGIDDAGLKVLAQDSINRRLEWFYKNKKPFEGSSTELLEAGYSLLLERLRIPPEKAPIVKQTERSITFRSCNFCPTLEACKILGLDTRYICKRLNEASTGLLLKQLNPRLSFARNYEALRPYTDYCEEMILLD